MSDKLMALIDRYADLVYKSRTEPVSKYELREYDAIRCRMDIEEALSDARSQAFEECAKIVEGFSPTRPAFITEDEGGMKWPHPAQQMPIYNPETLSQAIRQHSQKGRDK